MTEHIDTPLEEMLRFEIAFLERRIKYLEGIVERQNRIRREISSYLIAHRKDVNVIDALDIIYPKVDVYTQPEEPGKGTEE